MLINNMPICSIIVPIYNAGKYLQSCIDSILSQSFRDFELILVNDGSLDNSYAIAEAYQHEDSRVCVFSHENSGIAATRQRGLLHATGDWIMFVDADDFLLPNALKILFNNIDGVDIVNASVIGTEGRLWEHAKIGVMSRDDYIKSILDSSTFSYAYAKLFRREIVSMTDLELPSNLKIGEDVIMNLKIASKIIHVRNITDVVYCYRKNYDSTMMSFSRSVLYYIRYYNLRNAYLTAEQQLYSLPFDIKTLASAFYDDNIPYREAYYNALCDYLSKNGVIINEIPHLNNKYISLMYKTVYYIKKQFQLLVRGKKRRVILD